MRVTEEWLETAVQRIHRGQEGKQREGNRGSRELPGPQQAGPGYGAEMREVVRYWIYSKD